MGAFDHPKWTYDGALEQLFGPGRGNLNKNFQKVKIPRGLPGGEDVEIFFQDVHVNRSIALQSPYVQIRVKLLSSTKTP